MVVVEAKRNRPSGTAIMCQVSSLASTFVHCWPLSPGVPSWRREERYFNDECQPTLQPRWKGKHRSSQPLVRHQWCNRSRHSWCRMWSRSTWNQNQDTIYTSSLLTIVCKVVPQMSTPSWSDGGVNVVAGQEVPHLASSTLFHRGGSTFPQWQNCRSLTKRIC